MPRVSSRDLNQRRSEILDRARRCFAQYGYEGATVRRLEEATGKSRGAIFHHFRDKEHLFLELAREDAARMADVTAREGLVEVMREMLHHPERHDWLSTRLEITRMLRTDPQFRTSWMAHQKVLDQAVRDRLTFNAEHGRMRTDVGVDVLMAYLGIFMDGFMSQLASGANTEVMEDVLSLIERTIRTATPLETAPTP